MARRKGKATPLSLRGRYGHRLAELRARYVGEAERLARQSADAGAELAEIAAAQARAQARRAESDYRIMAREFRREVSKLKKSGLAPSGLRATTAKPSPGILKRLENLHDVVTGRARAVKVGKKRAGALKREGYETRNGRVIVSPEYKVSRRGEVTRESGFELRRRVNLNDPMKAEDTVRRVFRDMARDEYVAMEIGDNLSMFYHSGQERVFLATLLGYRDRDARYVTIVRMREAAVDSFVQEHTHERVSRHGEEKRQRKNEKRREKRRHQTRPAGVGRYLHSGKFGAPRP